AFIERAEGAQIPFGDGRKQRLVARAAIHVLTVASPARKSFTYGRKFSGPVPSAKYALAKHFEHPLSVSLPEDAIIGHVGRRLALELAPHRLAQTIRDPAVTALIPSPAADTANAGSRRRSTELARTGETAVGTLRLAWLSLSGGRLLRAYLGWVVPRGGGLGRGGGAGTAAPPAA